MDTWSAMSRDALDSALLLRDAEKFRSSVSRAYYAAYCAVTGELSRRRVTFPHGWNNPAHDQLPEFVLNNLALPQYAKYEINKALRRLRQTREDADYRPRVGIAEDDAIKSFRDAAFILRILEVME